MVRSTEDLGGIEKALPIPNSTPEAHEASEHAYYFRNTSLDEPTPQGVWADGGPTMDGRGTYTARDRAEPEGQKPDLGHAREKSGAQSEQMRGPEPAGAATRPPAPWAAEGGVVAFRRSGDPERCPRVMPVANMPG